ncbi:reverse transcriptase domain-containing protein [Tanacetum coccineum]|uniref:Reverse transcriptase domain-containing protein n=1 Tax=Tanacetum coccineum TaxID=301880 RepID=A0ABQ5DTI6_9ASTR
MENRKLKQILVQISGKIVTFCKTLKKRTKKSDCHNGHRKPKKAFKADEKLIAELPTLTAPRENEELIIYLAAAKEAINAVLMTDREGRQTPVYFVSRTYEPEVKLYPDGKVGVSLLMCKQRKMGIKNLQSMLTQNCGYQLTALKSPKSQAYEKEILDIVEEEDNTWMTPICEYLTKEILPEDKKKARAVRRKAAREGRKGKRGEDLFPEGPDSAFPGEIISDNGKQFRDNPFKDWCEKLCIRQCFASGEKELYPTSNALVEKSNRSLGGRNKGSLMKKAILDRRTSACPNGPTAQ